MNKLFSALLPLFLLLALPAQASEVAGIKFDDKVVLASTELALNGAGLRTKLFFKVYAIALYLPQKADGADAVLASKGPRRVQIVTLRDLTAEQLSEALIESIAANHSEADNAKLAARVEQLKKIMLSIGKVPEKTVINLDYLPATGTRVIVGNEQKGADIAGDDFYTALLRIWLGNKPVQNDIKDRLSGK